MGTAGVSNSYSSVCNIFIFRNKPPPFFYCETCFIKEGIPLKTSVGIAIAFKAGGETYRHNRTVLHLGKSGALLLRKLNDLLRIACLQVLSIGSNSLLKDPNADLWIWRPCKRNRGAVNFSPGDFIVSSSQLVG